MMYSARDDGCSTSDVTRDAFDDNTDLQAFRNATKSENDLTLVIFGVGIFSIVDFRCRAFLLDRFFRELEDDSPFFAFSWPVDSADFFDESPVDVRQLLAQILETHCCDVRFCVGTSLFYSSLRTGAKQKPDPALHSLPRRLLRFAESCEYLEPQNRTIIRTV